MTDIIQGSRDSSVVYNVQSWHSVTSQDFTLNGRRRCNQFPLPLPPPSSSSRSPRLSHGKTWPGSASNWSPPMKLHSSRATTTTWWVALLYSIITHYIHTPKWQSTSSPHWLGKLRGPLLGRRWSGKPFQPAINGASMDDLILDASPSLSHPLKAAAAALSAFHRLRRIIGNGEVTWVQ